MGVRGVRILRCLELESIQFWRKVEKEGIEWNR
jgi:hypothetical protein